MTILNTLGHGLSEKIGNIGIGQMRNFLRISGESVGLIQDFKYPKLEWRMIHHKN